RNDCTGLGGHRADANQFGQREQTALKLADRECGATDTTGRKRCGNPRAVRQPRVEQRPKLADILAQMPGYHHRCGPDLRVAQADPGYRFTTAVTFDENSRTWIDHDFGDI